MITETRKQIIELIEPYMDKTLSEWCLFYNKFNNRLVKIWISWNITKDKDWEYYELMFDLHKIDKIIWHYDITAVLKYIWNNNWNFQQTYKDDFIWMTWKNLENSISDIAIPNKPLHLYEEQEDKQLLELLTKIK